MNKYKIIGLISSALAAAVCFFAYFCGGEDSYGFAFAAVSVCFFISGLSELMTKRGGGTSAYIKPAVFFILTVISLTLAVWLILQK